MSFTSTDLFIEILRIGIMVLMQKVESTAADAAYSRTSTHNIHLHVCCRPDRSISGKPIDQHLERVVTKSHQKNRNSDIAHRHVETVPITMSALGQKQTYAVQYGTSALRHKRTIRLSQSSPLHPQTDFIAGLLSTENQRNFYAFSVGRTT